MAHLYGRAGRLTAKNGGSRPGRAVVVGAALDCSALPAALRLYLPLLLESMFKLPVRSGPTLLIWYDVMAIKTCIPVPADRARAPLPSDATDQCHRLITDTAPLDMV